MATRNGNGQKAGRIVARMSVDDKVSRDPRITMLSKALGWSRRETVGCLIVEVWPICYDQETSVVAEKVIDTATDCVGFAQAMIDAGLATRDRSGKVRVSGAEERIEYLNHKKKSGRQGGLKSGESRLKTPKQKASTGEADVKQGGSTPQARGNPSVPDPVPVPVPVPDPVPVLKNTDGPADAGPVESLVLDRKSSAEKKAAAVPERAWKCADYLRGLITTEDPGAVVARREWGPDVKHGLRLEWANAIRLMVERDGRTYEQIAEVLNYVFREQGSGPRFIVQSAAALRDKWDQIQAVRRNKTSGPRTEIRNIEEL